MHDIDCNRDSMNQTLPTWLMKDELIVKSPTVYFTFLFLDQDQKNGNSLPYFMAQLLLCSRWDGEIFAFWKIWEIVAGKNHYEYLVAFLVVLTFVLT
mmetsp:Transcript_136664/g.237285  ORF Transcript_136664/g.237285 Transcript_136664/m.237285 type:complete len:97 (-) Transcript_136664:272-562(-)